ncbi:MAG: hypothetical protein JSV49_04395 [Thermoplasmata archaeon]|nr:MAG: hypothetical protein JSV49_04395 [Thermoplasmata archaeon]
MPEGFATDYTVTPNKFVTGITWFVIIMFLVMATIIPVVIYITERHLLATFGFIALILSVFIPTLLLSWAYSPQKYEVTDEKITIVRPRNPIVIPLAKIIKVEPKDFKAHKLMRKWGNGGLFSITGKFWSKSEGNFWCYGKNDNYVMLHADKKWVVTPDDKEIFIQDVRSKVERARKKR